MKIKNTLIIIATLLLLIVLYIGIKSPSINLLGGASSEKTIEFKNTRVVGRANGKKIWEVSADEIWSTKNQKTTTFEHVKDGIIYKNGKIIVKNLHARRVTSHKWSGELEAYAFIEEPDSVTRESSLRALIDIENISSEEGSSRKQRFINLMADKIIYNPKTEIALAEGNVVIIEKDFKIFGDRMEIKGQSKKAFIDGNVRVIKADTNISGKKLVSDFNENSHKISEYVEVFQKDKAAISEFLTMNETTGEIILESNVKFLIEKGAALINDGSAKNLRNPEAETAIKEKTIIECNKLKLSTSSKNAEAYGSVVISQKGKKAKSDKAIYDGETETIVLTGNVFIEKKGEWLKTEKVLVSVKNESFEAVGKVEAEFRIER